jgi:ligand-binding sensor domain-containing protein/serine phosphatase RsbU (regulator of sigma subunit)/ABC-type amino acid transport substrate-binding protein
MLRWMYRILFCVFIGTFSFPILARDVDEIKRSGKIIIAFTETDLEGINYKLAQEFARYLNVEMEPVVIEWEEVFQINGRVPSDVTTNPDVAYTPDIFKQVDLICSTFTILEWRKKLFDFAQTLYSAEIIMINEEDNPPKNLDDLVGKKIAFLQGTSFETHIQQINKNIGGSIDLCPTESSEEAKQMLIDKEVFGVILDADEALNFRVDQKNAVKIGIPITGVVKTAFAVEKKNPLKNEVENFFNTIPSNGVLDKIFSETFGMTYSAFYNQISRINLPERLNRDLDEILKSGKLVVALRERNFIYKENGPIQFMHALAEEFANYLGVELEYVITPYFAKYWENEEGEVIKDSSYTPEWFNYFDLAAELIAPLDWRTSKVNLTGIYTSEYTIIAKNETSIHSISDLRKLKGITGKGTVYEDILASYGITNLEYAEVNEFIPSVNEGKVDYTLIYNAFLELSDYPSLEVKLPLGQVDVCWALRKNQPLLQDELNAFIAKSMKNGLIKTLLVAIKGQHLENAEDLVNSYYGSIQAGQMPYVIYGAEDGLPQEDVFSIYQDNRGYMWFGTSSGVVRYNGREMVVYNTEDGLADNTILDIQQDAGGTLYLATSHGISMINNDSVTGNILPGISFNKIFIDTDDNKWFLGDNGIHIVDKNDRHTYLNETFPLLPKNIYSMAEDSKNQNKYFASSDGVYLYSRKDNTLVKVSEEGYALFIDSNDSIWIYTSRGLYIAAIEDLVGGHFNERSRNLNESLIFHDQMIKGIYQDSYGTIWIYTDSEIYQVLSTSQKAIRYEQEVGVRSNKILSLWVDIEDNIWIGFSGGLQRLTNKRGLRNFYPNTIQSYIYSIFQDKSDRIWIASNDGLFYFSDRLVNYSQRLSSEKIRYVTGVLPDDNILVASSAGLYEINVHSLRVRSTNSFSKPLSGIEKVYLSSSGEIFLLTGINGIIYYFKNFAAAPLAIENSNTSNIFELIEHEGEIIGGNKNELVAFRNGDFVKIGETDCNIWSLFSINQQLWIGTECGLGLYENDQYTSYNLGSEQQYVSVKAIQLALNKFKLWLGTNNGFSYFSIPDKQIEFTIDSEDGLLGDEITVGGLFIDNNDLLWIGTYHGLSNFNFRAKSVRNLPPMSYIERITLNGKEIDRESGKVFRHFQNNLVFEISGLSFSDEKSIEYEFYLRGLENDYSSYHKGREYKAYYNNLPPGKYEFIYKARGKNNIWGYAQKYQFTIRKAWYQTWIFRIVVVLLFTVSIWLLYKARIKAIQAQKKRLEKLVKERTHELEEANIEIEAQRDLATHQRDQISQQKKEIEDSIYYAERIQRSLLPSKVILESIVPDYFIFFRPRDIVSGDFYWSSRMNGKLIVTAVDCTGHGVPGAFMSMLGIAYLNEIVNKLKDLNANDILNYLRDKIIHALGQTGKEGESKDGMDMALCIIDPEEKIMQYSGANNPLYLVRNGELLETKADKMPVAIHEQMVSFSNHQIQLQKGDNIYLFSDGYADQFGGPKGKKFMYKPLKRLLVEIADQSMAEQHKILEKTIYDWQGPYEQIDDMVFIGIKI